MSKYATIIFVLLCGSIGYAQCNNNSLKLNFLGKKYYEVNNALLADDNVMDLRENLSYDDRKFSDDKFDYTYLTGTHYRKFLNFKYKLHQCFTNADRNDFVEYTIVMVDDVVYKVTVRKSYKLDDEKWDSDYLRLDSMIRTEYPINDGSYSISNKFNVTSDNKEGESIKTGSSNSYSKPKLPKSKIWKVNSAEVTLRTDYTRSSSRGYIFPSIGTSIIIEFVDLNSTVLDNRGY